MFIIFGAGVIVGILTVLLVETLIDLFEVNE